MTSQEVAKSLYSLTEELSLLMDEITGADGELSENLEASHNAVMSLISSKTDGVCGWVSSQDHLIALADLKLKEISAFKKKIVDRLDRFDGYVNACLLRAGTMKLEGDLHIIKKRKPTKIVVIKDESHDDLNPFIVRPPAPDAYLDKKEIAKVLKTGVNLGGVSLEDSPTISLTYGLK